MGENEYRLQNLCFPQLFSSRLQQIIETKNRTSDVSKVAVLFQLEFQIVIDNGKREPQIGFVDKSK